MVNSSPAVSNLNISRIKWTREECEEFLKDSETLPMLKVMEKWNILRKSKFYSTRNYVRILLKEMTI